MYSFTIRSTKYLFCLNNSPPFTVAILGQKKGCYRDISFLTNYKLSYVAQSSIPLLWFCCPVQSAVLTLSATPPGRIVLTTTPVLRPPIISNPNPEPSFIRSITSTCAHSVFSCENKTVIY